MISPGKPCIQCEGSHMGKAVEHLEFSTVLRLDITNQFLQGKPILLLIQEEARLLSISNIHVILDAILIDDHMTICIRMPFGKDKACCKILRILYLLLSIGQEIVPALMRIHTFLLANRRIRSLEDTTDPDSIFSHGKNKTF